MIWYEVTFTYQERGGEPKTKTEKITDESFDDERAKDYARKIVGSKWGIIKSFRRIEDIKL